MISVLIRVLNEERALRQLFECLRVQKIDRPLEVVVIDNESDDESAEVAIAMGARVFMLPRSLFTYGRALNVGVKLCRGDLIVLLSAHSWPQGHDWLSRMVNFVEGRSLAAAYCRRLSDGGARQKGKTQFNAFAERNYKLDMEMLVQRCQSGEDVYEVCSFSNSAAIVRREVVLRFPFRDLPFAEDRAFVLDCVMGGHAIAYLSTASVTYQQPATFKNSCRIGWAGTIAGHLIRELGTEALGTDLSKSELTRKAVRLIVKSLEIIGQTIQVVLRDKMQVRRAARYAAISCAASLGCIVGELTWQRYRKTSSCDSTVLSTAEKSIKSAEAENAVNSLT